MNSLNSTSSYLTQQFDTSNSQLEIIFRRDYVRGKRHPGLCTNWRRKRRNERQQLQLVTMLFDGVLSALVRARLFMQDNNQQGKGVSLSKAINIIENGLRVSLDEESKDEI